MTPARCTWAVRFLGSSLIALFCCGASLSQSRAVALTFDDLPAAGTTDPAEFQSINRAILRALDRHHPPAIGFVNGQKISSLSEPARGQQILASWVRHGYDLGNHTFSHADANLLDAEDFEHEIIAGEASVKLALAPAGKQIQYLRFPYNHTGDTVEKHNAIAAYLAQHGYKVATCTIDNSDYIFNAAYLKMLAKGDQQSAQRLRDAYLEYTSVEIDYYAGLHKQVFGHEIPQVMLLHANRLNAELLDKILKIFEQKHYKFVDLSTAQSDPAYRTPDTLVSKFGWMWGYRWAKELGVKVDGSLETEPPDWIAKYGQ
jgi:peptidoglycan/xylan/chitin deacetylase (PgdA/CDA1 family)